MNKRLRVARVITMVIIVLTAVASLTGLFAPSIYRETAWVVPQNRGQDLVTLIALTVLIPAVMAARSGSPRATLIWMGLLGYLAYTYTGAAFAYAFNFLFPVYVALFSLAGTALIAVLSGISPSAIHGAFDVRAPRRGAAVFLLMMAFALCLLWIGQIVPFYTRDLLPDMIIKAKTPTVYVYVLDLGVVVPLALLSAWWLWRDRAWGFVLTGFVLVKATTMGMALLAMTFFALRADQEVDATLTVAWITLAIAGLGMSVWFFRHCHRLIASSSQQHGQ